MDYCYFNNRYMTSVMETLYSDPDSYPNVIDCLLRAEPTHYFRLSQSIDGVYDVAQKYGSFDDQIGQKLQPHHGHNLHAEPLHRHGNDLQCLKL